jgi:hypothetical protein
MLEKLFQRRDREVPVHRNNTVASGPDLTAVQELLDKGRPAQYVRDLVDVLREEHPINGNRSQGIH